MDEIQRAPGKLVTLVMVGEPSYTEAVAQYSCRSCHMFFSASSACQLNT